jgi:hypothetical protein
MKRRDKRKKPKKKLKLSPRIISFNLRSQYPIRSVMISMVRRNKRKIPKRKLKLSPFKIK